MPSSSTRKPADPARVKYAEYCRQAGKPLHVTDEECAGLRRHIARLYNRGMSFPGIAEESGAPETVIARILYGDVLHPHRDTYNAIMSASFVTPSEVLAGRYMESTGLRRRIQALVYAGFGYNVLGGVLGVSPQAVHQLCVSNGPVRAVTLGKVVLLYDKLQHADPYDHGAVKQGVTRAKNVARRYGWVPGSCWDLDTIDDPYAAPEWTGRCGTFFGWMIHESEGIPACGRCAVAGASGSAVFLPLEFRKLRERAGLSRPALAEKIGVNPSTLQYWEAGRSAPTRQGKLELALRILDATYEDVYQEVPNAG